MNKIVIKLGGSVLFNDDGEFKLIIIERLIEVIQQLQRNNLILLVVGGGSTSRSIVRQMRDRISNQSYLDHLSILATRFHAETIRGMFIENGMETRFITRYEELFEVYHQNTIYIMGGLFPGQSTNGAAAVAAEAIDATRIFNLFNYNHILSKDPERDEGGKVLEEISYQDMEELITDFKQQPGHYELFDSNALKFVRRSAIEVVFLNGNEPGNILKWEVGSGIGTLLH